jgi:hypothetical protein
MTDNLGLLTRIQQCLPYPNPFLNTTLQSNWDVTNESIVTLQDMKIKPIFKHVKGHQDDHRPYDSLPLDAQLNLDANHEAENYQAMFPANRPLIPRLPHNCVQLHIDNKVISSKLKQSIWDAFKVTEYMEYLKKWHHWSSECLARSTGRHTTRPSADSTNKEFRSQNCVTTCSQLPVGQAIMTPSPLTTAFTVVSAEIATTLCTVLLPCAKNGKNKFLLIIYVSLTTIPLLTCTSSISSLLASTHASTTLILIGLDTLVGTTKLNEQTAIGRRQLFNGHLSKQWRIPQDIFLPCGKLHTCTHTGANWSL